MVRLAILALCGCACACGGGIGNREPEPRIRNSDSRFPIPYSSAPSDAITLYRGLAVVRQRVVVEAGPLVETESVQIAAGVDAAQVMVVDRGGLSTIGLHPGGPGGALELDVTAPRAGHYTVALAYLTDRLAWDAAYTLTTTPARDRAVLRGALAIRNTTGLALHGAALRVVDSELAAARAKTAETLAAQLSGAPPPGSPSAVPRELGRVDLGAGETRVELAPGAPARAMRSVLVYDPIGTRLDLPTSAPSRDPSLGIKPPAASSVTESFEIARDPAASAGLPGGPVHLLERRAGGALALLGEARLFDAKTRDATVDTISVGTADGVTARRERRELTIDDDNRRLVEEFAIAIDNQRVQPARVLIREHLYRGLEWHLAYPVQPVAEKEGDQQIAMRVVVPAHAKASQLYVVVYTWDR
jgi:hypothetical protein